MIKDKIYFASDFHLGSPNLKDSHKREKLIVKWLDEIKKDAKAIYLVGDIFDFWFEYNNVVPKGFVRLLGKLSALTDSGIEVHFIVGNHDMWMRDYLTTEIGIILHYENIIITENNKTLFIGHGDGLGKGDYTYKLLKKIFSSSVCKWLFARIHPNLGVRIAQIWSQGSRSKNNDAIFMSEEQEILVGYCREQQRQNPIDYYIFGHRHLPLEIKIDKQAKYINLGDWISHYTYAVFDGESLELKTYAQ